MPRYQKKRKADQLDASRDSVTDDEDDVLKPAKKAKLNRDQRKAQEERINEALVQAAKHYNDKEYLKAFICYKAAFIEIVYSSTNKDFIKQLRLDMLCCRIFTYAVPYHNMMKELAIYHTKLSERDISEEDEDMENNLKIVQHIKKTFGTDREAALYRYNHGVFVRDLMLNPASESSQMLLEDDHRTLVNDAVAGLEEAADYYRKPHYKKNENADEAKKNQFNCYSLIYGLYETLADQLMTEFDKKEDAKTKTELSVQASTYYQRAVKYTRKLYEYPDLLTTQELKELNSSECLLHLSVLNALESAIKSANGDEKEKHACAMLDYSNKYGLHKILTDEDAKDYRKHLEFARTFSQKQPEKKSTPPAPTILISMFQSTLRTATTTTTSIITPPRTPS